MQLSVASGWEQKWVTGPSKTNPWAKEAGFPELDPRVGGASLWERGEAGVGGGGVEGVE